MNDRHVLRMLVMLLFVSGLFAPLFGSSSSYLKDSAGNDATDTINHASKVTIVTGVQTAGMVPSNGCALQRTGGIISSATTTTAVSAVASQGVTIFGVFFMVGATADTVTLQSTTPTNLIGTSATLPFAANGSLVLDRTGQQWFASTASGTGLQIVTSSAGPLTWYFDYTQC